MAKIVTYNTLVRVGQAILTEAQKEDKNSIKSLTGEFKGYINSQNELSETLLEGDFYITSTIMTFSFGNGSEVMALAKDSIVIAMKDNPSSSNRNDWVVIKSKLVNEMVELKNSLEDHINDTNNPHNVTLTQANGDVINDNTFIELLSLV